MVGSAKMDRSDQWDLVLSGMTWHLSNMFSHGVKDLFDFCHQTLTKLRLLPFRFTKRTVNIRVSEQVKDLTVYMTTPELKKWLKGKDELIMLIGRITSLSPAFKCCKSNEDEAFMESATRLLEFWLSCVTIGDPGYILEKHFDLGDPNLEMRGLGNLLAPTGVGMKDAVVVAIVSVLGCEKFCLFVELYLGHKLEIDHKLEWPEQG